MMSKHTYSRLLKAQKSGAQDKVMYRVLAIDPTGKKHNIVLGVPHVRSEPIAITVDRMAKNIIGYSAAQCSKVWWGGKSNKYPANFFVS